MLDCVWSDSFNEDIITLGRQVVALVTLLYIVVVSPNGLKSNLVYGSTRDESNEI